MRDVLARRDVRLLVGGQAISQAGDWLFGVALLVWLLDVTGSAVWVGVAGAIQLLPWILLSPVAGLLADRLDRRRVLIACDLVQLAAMVVLAAVAALDGPPWLALAVATVASLAGVGSGPSLQAAWPVLVSERELASVNAIMSAIVSLSMVVGPALGAVLLVLGSPAAAFGLNAVTFALSAACFALVRSPMGPLPDANGSAIDGSTAASTDGLTAARIGAAMRTAGADLADGARALATSPAAAALVVVSAAILLAYSAQVVLWAVLAEERLPAGADSLTLLYVAYGIGGLAATVPGSRAASGSSTGLVLAAAVGIGALSVMALALAGSLAPSVALIAIQGLVVTVADVLVITLLQRSLGPAILGRAIGTMDSLTSVAMVAGSMLAPLLLAAFGLGASFLAAGAVLVGAAAVAALAVRTQVGPSPVVAQRARVLAGSPLFAAAPRFALEGLAAECHELDAAAGTVLIREGDQPDDLYVIVRGTVAITTGATATLLNTLGPGDFFGEIGLLKQVPRTATVTVATPATLLRLDGQVFLSLVRTGVAHRGTLGRSVGVRLSQRETVHEASAHG